MRGEGVEMRERENAASDGRERERLADFEGREERFEEDDGLT